MTLIAYETSYGVYKEMKVNKDFDHAIHTLKENGSIIIFVQHF